MENVIVGKWPHCFYQQGTYPDTQNTRAYLYTYTQPGLQQTSSLHFLLYTFLHFCQNDDVCPQKNDLLLLNSFNKLSKSFFGAGFRDLPQPLHILTFFN